MSNILACAIFNLVGLGTSYFLFFLAGKFKGKREQILLNPGTSIFWGFLAAMLFTYVLWFFISYRLDVACYITFAVAIGGIVSLAQDKKFKEFFKTDYFLTLIFLLPFIFLIKYSPRAWDEFSHWLFLPKMFYCQNSLVPEERWSTATYTPLWTLQGAFFQFFPPIGFNESLLYAVRINFLVSFFFFIKEKEKFKNLEFILFTIGALAILWGFGEVHALKYLLIELPIYLLLTSLLFLVGGLKKRSLVTTQENVLLFILGLLSCYMLKKSLIAFLPAGIFILWRQGYRKHIFYLLLSFGFLYFSWKIKTAHLEKGSQFNFVLEKLWGVKAILIYKQLFMQFYEFKGSFLLFILCMYVLYKRSKNVFLFCFISAIFYYFGMVLAYIYSFSDFEAAYLASYQRYLTVLFVPVFMYTWSLFMSGPGLKKIGQFYSQTNFSKKKCLSSFLDYLNNRYWAIFIVCLCVLASNYKGFVRAPSNFPSFAYKKLQKAYNMKNKTIIILDQGGDRRDPLRLKYYAYEDTKKSEGGSYGPTADNYWRKVVNRVRFTEQLKRYDVIMVLHTDKWLNEIIFQLCQKNTNNLKSFALLKTKSRYELVAL